MTKLIYEPIRKDEAQYREAAKELYSLFLRLQVLFEEKDIDDEEVIDINAL